MTGLPPGAALHETAAHDFLPRLVYSCLQLSLKEGIMKHRVVAAGILIFASITLFAPGVRGETAQQNKMKDCNTQADAKGLKGAGKGSERQAFMKECLSAKPAAAAGGATTQQEKMKTCNAEATAKGLKGDARKEFMSGCLKK